MENAAAVGDIFAAQLAAQVFSGDGEHRPYDSSPCVTQVVADDFRRSMNPRARARPMGGQFIASRNWCVDMTTVCRRRALGGRRCSRAMERSSVR
jgi:hypothetical protein